MSTRSIKQPRACPVHGCTVLLGRSLLMCVEHWNMCPKPLRNEVWRYYRPGQERTGQPSPMYYDAARAAIDAVNKEISTHREKGVQQVLL